MRDREQLDVGRSTVTFSLSRTLLLSHELQGQGNTGTLELKLNFLKFILCYFTSPPDITMSLPFVGKYELFPNNSVESFIGC